jgi:sensor histidine kinase YesM
LRYADRVDIRFEVGDLLDSYQMPPLILSVFVENAFKHGVSYNEPSFIHISLQVIDKRLVFRCVNSKHERRMPSSGGIGLENVKKRLQLIYGDEYHLEINDGIEKYCVLLTIPLNKNFQ